MIEGLEELASRAMDEWQVPGLALAVVRRDGPAILHTYGQRDVEAGLPVTADTPFAICSLTKSFTAMSLALLVDEGRLDWSKPVRQYIPEFRLNDPVATERVTVRDLLCHHSGLPQHDWVVDPGDWSREQIMAAMAHLEPSADIRSTFQYCNLGYVVAGIVAERIAGMSWEHLVRERLTDRLEMAVTFNMEDLAGSRDAAVPYAMHGDKRARTAFWPMRDTSAGGINASIASLASWLAFLLHGGEVGGKPLVSPAVFGEILTPRVHVRRSEFPEIDHVHYGLGLASQGYRGTRAVLHDGSWIGWGGLMCLLPERGIGAAVLTNRDQSPVGSILINHVFDRLCGWEPIDWIGRFRAARRERLKQNEAKRAAHLAARYAGTRPSRSLSDYAGAYEHPGYGRMEIACADGALHWRFRGLSAPLTHWHFDTFQLPEASGRLLPHELPMTFSLDREGNIASLCAPFEPLVNDIVFRRVVVSG